MLSNNGMRKSSDSSAALSSLIFNVVYLGPAIIYGESSDFSSIDFVCAYTTHCLCGCWTVFLFAQRCGYTKNDSEACFSGRLMC